LSAHFFIFEAVKANGIYRFVKFLKKFYFKNDKRVAAYLICVVIATGFWFLNALSKTYTVQLKVPVQYYNFPNNKTFAGHLPEQFELTVRAHGFTILRQKLGSWVGPLEFNVNEMTNERMAGNQRTRFAFPTRQFLPALSYQMSSDLEVLNMNPDTLFFGFGEMEQKQVRVKPLVELKMKKQYQLSGEIKSAPSEVLVSGPTGMIDTLQFVYTRKQVFEKADKSIRTIAQLEPIKEMYFNRQEVEITVPIEEYTEAQQLVPVLMHDAPSEIKVKLFPSRVKVSFLVGLSQFSEIRPENFKLAVSYADIEKGTQRLPIKALSVPPFLYDVKISPEEIEYLIEK
jgi:hypothetical protein